jgi:ApeA N-terminal domain 1
MTILEDRGLFWWNNQKVPKEQFAPSECVHGKLTVSDDGQVRLDLDTVMPGDRPWDNLANTAKPVGRNIQGLLKTKSEKVLLLGLTRAGGTFRSNNLSPASYIASNCLVSENRFRRDTGGGPTCREIEVELAGLEEWLWLGSITSKRTHASVSARYVAPKPLKFTGSFGTLSIEYNLTGPWFGKIVRSKLTLVESAVLRLKLGSRMPLETFQTYYQRIEELIVLLTSNDRSLDWPTVIFAGGQRAKNYFFRSRVEAEPPRAHECLVNFSKIASTFGELFSSLLSKREEFGPGFYLYLGTRRGMKMFVEHRFVNLIWGLEAFDRRARSPRTQALLGEKVARILNDVTNPSDKKWLGRQLRHAGEPNLAQRLFDVFKGIPLDYDLKALRRFCEECQNRRNDISHWGGLRQEGQDYQTFMQDIDEKSDALSALYHLHLLVVIGVDRERLNFATNQNWPLSRMEIDLRQVGILKTKPSYV